MAMGVCCGASNVNYISLLINSMKLVDINLTRLQENVKAEALPGRNIIDSLSWQMSGFFKLFVVKHCYKKPAQNSRLFK